MSSSTSDQASPKTPNKTENKKAMNKENGTTALISMGGGLKVFWTAAVLVYAFLSPVHSTFRFLLGLLMLGCSIITGPFMPLMLTIFLLKTKPPRTMKLLLLLNPDRQIKANQALEQDTKEEANIPTDAKASPNDLTQASFLQKKIFQLKSWLQKYSTLCPFLLCTAIPCLLAGGILPFIAYFTYPDIHGKTALDLYSGISGGIVLLTSIGAVLINGSINTVKAGLPHPFFNVLKTLGSSLVQLIFFSIACALSIPITITAGHALWATLDNFIVNRYDLITGLSPYLSIATLDKLAIGLAAGAIIYAMSAIIHKISDLSIENK